MVFSSVTFLFCFLPLVLALYYGVKNIAWRNTILLLASLIFYAWGEGWMVILMLVSCTLNYFVGLGIHYAKQAKVVLAVGVISNLALLGYYKYFGLFTSSINAVLPESWQLNIQSPLLPIGISFFTFQGISYLVDVYRKQSPVQKNILNLSLYIALFPQLIAGPIVRYNDVSREISSRVSSLFKMNEGIKRFAIGLGKKVIIANAMGEMADAIFALDHHFLSIYLAWIGIIAYALQIYFDFSGYSDMAIGLGKMFGFHFLENFNLPYISKSIQEFWRRWHISLSTWFRDYLYIPLGGNRKGPFKTYLFLSIVFFTTGLWHGASWSFVFWGLFHGFFMIIERLGFAKVLAKNALLGHGYTLLVVLFGWVFFRVENFTDALSYCATMVDVNQITNFSTASIQFSAKFVVLFILAIFFSTAWPEKIVAWFKEKSPQKIGAQFYPHFANAFYFGLLLYSSMSVASGTYNPFIYFRF